MLFFALENSPNVLLKEGNGQREAYAHRVKLLLNAAVPHFEVDWKVLTLSPILPHERKRCWIRGMRKDAMLQETIPQIISDLPEVTLKGVLDTEANDVSLANFGTARVRENLQKYIEAVLDHRSKGKAGGIAVVEVNRGFNCKYPAQIHYDKVPRARLITSAIAMNKNRYCSCSRIVFTSL